MLVLPSDGELRRLVHAAQGQSPEAFSALYDLFAAPLVRYFRCGVAEMQRAEDLVGPTFVALIDVIGEVRLPRHGATLVFVGWLYQLAARHLRTWLDCQRNDRELAARAVGGESDDDARTDSPIANGQFHGAFGRLTAEQQMVVVLRCVERLSLPEVAVSLGLSVAHVASVQHKGLAVLADCAQPA
ncbi:MAG: sigma-70 family RNA polymerase sigma factor [Chloroflexota bacterium]|nr:sigma-70 family RNA polymerase sigma factor [Chloroflexota bacterium]